MELKAGPPNDMVLRGTYGQKVHEAFRISRQGVRWRFWHLFNEIYVESLSVILAIEKAFGTQLRDHAIRISHERYQVHQECLRSGFQNADVWSDGPASSAGEAPVPDAAEKKAP